MTPVTHLSSVLSFVFPPFFPYFLNEYGLSLTLIVLRKRISVLSVWSRSRGGKQNYYKKTQEVLVNEFTFPLGTQNKHKSIMGDEEV